jgi:hypothetical protein
MNEVASMYDNMSTEQEAIAPTNDEIKSVSLLVEKQLKLEDEVETLEQRLKSTKADLRKVSSEQLPDAMLALKCNKFEIDTGAMVEIDTGIHTTIAAKNKDWCFKWLRKHGHGDIIRDEIKTKFGVGEGNKAKSLTDYLDASKQPFSQSQTVHPQTLKAFVGVEMDEREPDAEWKDKFSVFERRTAKISRPE